jgi:CheY-like chemotaxis protein
VSSATDGPTAIALVQKALPDVVVMELVIPRTDGFEILRQLRETSLTADIPAIVVTASLHFDLPARARVSGAVLVLAKPMAVDALLSALDDVLSGIPPERLSRRRMMRALLIIRSFARLCPPDEDAQTRLRAFIDRLQVAVLAIDAEGRYVAASRGVTTMTGYSRTELLRMSVFDASLGRGLPLAQPWQEAQSHRDAVTDIVIQDARGQAINVSTTFDSIWSNMSAAALVLK